MEREKIIESCEEIFHSFERDVTTDEEMTLTGFLEQLTRPACDFVSDILRESELKFNGNDAEDTLIDDLWVPLATLAFGIGFTLGSLGETFNLKVKKSMEEVMRGIKESGIIAYIPKGTA